MLGLFSAAFATDFGFAGLGTVILSQLVLPEVRVRVSSGMSLTAQSLLPIFQLHKGQAKNHAIVVHAKQGLGSHFVVSTRTALPCTSGCKGRGSMKTNDKVFAFFALRLTLGVG